MIHATALLAIVLMAAATYATRIAGYIALSNRVLSARTRVVPEAAPACVLLAVIAPAFATPRPADLAASAITILAAIRLPMVAIVAVAIIASAALRFLLG